MRYDFKCEPCNKIVEVVRPIADAHLPATCLRCSSEMERVYSAEVQNEFREYYSGDCGAYISSREGEKRALKKKGLMLYADTPGYDKWKGKIKDHRKQAKHFMMGAK